MKKYFLSLLLVPAVFVFAGHHEEASSMKESNFAVLSSYTIAAGTKPSKLEKEFQLNFFS